MNHLISRAAVFCVTAIVFFASCSPRQLGLPREALSRSSPDGTAVAVVRNHPSIDPPKQSLWIRSGREERLVRRLGEDTHWCDRIEWSRSGDVAGYHVIGVSGATWVVADRKTGAVTETTASSDTSWQSR